MGTIEDVEQCECPWEKIAKHRLATCMNQTTRWQRWLQTSETWENHSRNISNHTDADQADLRSEAINHMPSSPILIQKNNDSDRLDAFSDQWPQQPPTHHQLQGGCLAAALRHSHDRGGRLTMTRTRIRAGEHEGYKVLKLNSKISGLGDTDTSSHNYQQILEIVCSIDRRISDPSPAAFFES